MLSCYVNLMREISACLARVSDAGASVLSRRPIGRLQEDYTTGDEGRTYERVQTNNLQPKGGAAGLHQKTRKWKRRGHLIASPLLRRQRGACIAIRSDRVALTMVNHIVRTRPTVLRFRYLNHQQIAKCDIQPTLGAVVATQSLAALLQGRGIRTHLCCLSHEITPLQRTRRRAAPRMLPAAIIREKSRLSKTGNRRWTTGRQSRPIVHRPSSVVCYPTCGTAASDFAIASAEKPLSASCPAR
jgi:hypothetical protein